MDKKEPSQDLALQDWKANNQASDKPTTPSTTLDNSIRKEKTEKTYGFKTIASGLVVAVLAGFITLIPFMFIYMLVEWQGFDSTHPVSSTQHILGGTIAVIGYVVAAIVGYRQLRKYLSEK